MWKTSLCRPAAFGAAVLIGLLQGCSNKDMYEQPRFDPLEPSRLFPDGRSARKPVEGTVARGYLRLDEWLIEPGKAGPEPARAAPRTPGAADSFPAPVTLELLARGRERYRVYCTPCHGAHGQGDGMITRHGFPNPPSFHLPRLLEAPASHYYNVITNGFGRMYPYAYRVRPEDRWAIIAYIRALQFSRHAPVSRLPETDRRKLEVLP